MKEIKLITIVVTFNGAYWIKCCLDSLICSDLPTKIIVVDNKSTDSTREIIKSHYPKVQLIESEENLGFGKGNNIGLKIALDLNADHVFLLNQDAHLEPNTLRKLVMVQKANTEYGVVSPIQLNGSGTLLDHYFLHYLGSSPVGGIELISQRIACRPVQDVYPMNFVNAAAWLLSKKCLKTVGGFDPLFQHYAEDNNYLDRLRYHGLKVGVVPDAMIYHDRENRANTWQNPFHREQDVFRRSLLINSLNPNQPADTKQIKKLLRIRFFKSIFGFDLKNIRLQRDIFKEYSANIDKIKENLQRSTQKGKTFL